LEKTELVDHISVENELSLEERGAEPCAVKLNLAAELTWAIRFVVIPPFGRNIGSLTITGVGKPSYLPTVSPGLSRDGYIG
jgi:hypothetical protein